MKRLYRDRWNKKIAGVCGGMGLYFKIDPTFIRLGLVFLGVLTGGLPFIVCYAIAWLIIPVSPATALIKNPGKQLFRSRRTRKIGGICGGLSEFFRLDATLVRLIFVALMMLTGFFPLIICYIIGCYIIPERPPQMRR